MTSSSVHAIPVDRSGAASTAAPATRPFRVRAASWSLVLSLIAALGASLAMAAVGLSMIPMETAHGRLLADTPAWYQWAVIGGFGSLVLWAVAGLAGIVLGVIALAAGQGRVRAILAIVLAVAAPLLALAVLMGAMGAGTALV